MVYLPKWVMYKDNLHKVSRRVKDKMYLYPIRFSFGWSDPRAWVGGGNTMEMIVSLDQCTPITDEVAQIMRGV